VPATTYGDNYVKISSSGFGLYDILRTEIATYDIPESKGLVISNNGVQVDSLRVSRDVASSSFTITSITGEAATEPLRSNNLYFVKKGNVFDRVDDITGLGKCDFSAKHKFRFCVETDDLVPRFIPDAKSAKEALEFDSVPIRFALDFKKLIPPPIAADSVEVADVPEQKATEAAQELAQAPEENKCQGFGNAEVNIKPTVPEMKSTFDGFVSNFLMDLLPSIGPMGALFSFLQDGLATTESLPAVMNIQVDLKGASRDCDIKGIVYKCGVGSIPYKSDEQGNNLLDIYGNRQFDFSNPTGFIDLSSRFDTKSSPALVQSASSTTPSAVASAACTTIKNPGGSYTNGQYILPQVEGDLVSFSVDRCVEPITQFKRIDGIDILTSLMDSGVGYYFAFAYVNSAGDYGKAKVIGEDTGIRIPSVFTKLLEEAGLSEVSGLQNLLSGDPSSIMNSLFGGDMYARALAWTSQQRYLNYASGDLFNNFVYDYQSRIPMDEKANMLMYAVRTGRIDESQAFRMVGDITQGMDYEKASSFISQLHSTDNLCSAYEAYSEQLPIERKRELLATVYSEEELQEMSEYDIDSALSETICKPGSGLSFIQGNMYPGEEILMVNNYLNMQPSQGIEMALNAIPQYEQAQVLTNFLSSANADFDRSLVTSMFSVSSPETLAGGFNIIISQLGFNYESGWAGFFQDFPCDPCQTASDALTNP
jgi:hypothetical protein